MSGERGAYQPCEFCGSTEATRLLRSEEERRKVRCCFDPAACLRRILGGVADLLDPTGIPETVNTREVRRRVEGLRPPFASADSGATS